jgi:hypothetical protein
MPDFICEECGKREFHENEDTLKMMVKIHGEFCRKREGQAHSFMHRDNNDDDSIDTERANDEKDVPILKK